MEIQSMLPALLDTTRAHPDTFKRMPDGNLNSLGTVLSQEIDSFNRLLRLMSSSLEELQKACFFFGYWMGALVLSTSPPLCGGCALLPFTVCPLNS